MSRAIRELFCLPKVVDGHIADVFTAIYDQRYTGPVTFHCKNGVPKTVQVPAPEIRLTVPDREETPRVHVPA